MSSSHEVIRPPRRGGSLAEDDGTRQPGGPYYHVSDEVLDYLFEVGLIQRLNDRFGLLIDLYEEELVKPEMLPEIIAMLGKEQVKLQDSSEPTISVNHEAGRQPEIPRVEVERALNGMRDFMAEAARKQRGVWIIF